jgi:hypothetical protein
MAKKFTEQAPKSVAVSALPSVAAPQQLKDLALTVPDMQQRVEHLRTSDQSPSEQIVVPVSPLPPPVAPSIPKQTTTKIGGMVSVDIADRLKMIAFTSKISESVILEMALRSFFGDQSDAEIGMRLRANGARRRRAFPK